MKRLLIILMATMVFISVHTLSYAQTIAETEFSLENIIDPLLKYLDCDRLNSLEQQVCKAIAGDFKQALSDAGVSIQSSGVLYSQNNLVPPVRIGSCAHSFKIDDSSVSVLASKESVFKLELGTLSKPLVFVAKIPTSGSGKINLHEAFGIEVPYPSTECRWEWGIPICWPTVDYYCVADDVITDHFTAEASITTNANLVTIFSLEPRLLPRPTPYDDYHVEIAPRILMDGNLDNVAMHFNIYGRDDIMDSVLGAVSVPADLDIALADAFKSLNHEDNNLIMDLGVLGLDTSSYLFMFPVIPSTLVAMEIDPGLFDGLFTDLVKREVQNEYSKGYQSLAKIINAKIAGALNLDTNGKRTLTIKKLGGGPSGTYDATLVGGQNYTVPIYQAAVLPYPSSNPTYCISSDGGDTCATAPVLGYLAPASFANSVPLYQAPGVPYPTSSATYCTGFDNDSGACLGYATAPVIGYLAAPATTNFTGGVPLYQAPVNPYPTTNPTYCIGMDGDYGACLGYATAPLLGYLAPAPGLNGGTYTCPYGGRQSGSNCTLPLINITASSGNFGNAFVHAVSPSQAFTIKNIGTDAAVFGTTTFTGANPTEFVITSDSCAGQTLAPSASCTIQAVFAPVSGGAKSASISISTSDPTKPVSNSTPLDVTGVGVSISDVITLAPAGWSTEGSTAVSTMYHSAPYSLELGNYNNTDGAISFVAPTSGLFSFWYYKQSEWGYYETSDYWSAHGNNVGNVTVSVNGSPIYALSADTASWTKTPPLRVNAGDTIKIAQTGSHDDNGAYCDSQPGGSCHGTDDRYDDVSVYIDDVAITGVTGNDTTPPVTTATPVGTSFSSPLTVFLSANEAATIYYTIDGTTPTLASPVYSAPLALGATTTLKYFAQDASGNVGTVATQVYTYIDITPPVTTASPAGGTYAAPQIVTLTTNEPATIYYTTNGTTPTTGSAVYSSPLAVSATETVAYFAVDAAGNRETPKTQTYTIDTTAPTAIASPPGGAYPTPQTVTLSTNEAATIYYTLDGTTPTTSSSVYSGPLAITTTTVLNYFAIDRIGNVESVKSDTYIILPPVTTYTQNFDTTGAVPAGWGVSGAVSLSNLHQSAPYGLMLGNGLDTDGSVSFVAPVSGNLSFAYSKSSAWGYYYQLDDWYEVGTNAGTMTVTVNGGVVYTASSDTGWVSTPQFSVHIGDTIRIAQTGNRDDDGSSCPGMCQNDPYYNISVYIDDINISGGSGNDTTTITTISSFNPPANASYNANQAVTLSIGYSMYGVKATYYSIDSGAYIPGTSFTISGDGQHNFSFYSVDNANNTEAARYSNTFRIDTVAPVSTCSAVNGANYAGSQAFSISATDGAGSGVAGTWYKLDSGPWTAGASVPVAASSSGSPAHTLSWYSVDNAGNQETAQSVSFNVLPPALPGSQTWTTSGTFTVPAGVTSLSIDALGGGGHGGSGTGGDGTGTHDGAKGGDAVVTYQATVRATAGGGAGGRPAYNDWGGAGGAGGIASGSLTGQTLTNGGAGSSGQSDIYDDGSYFGGPGGAPNGFAGSDGNDNYSGGGGGGGGGARVRGTLAVTQGSAVSITIGTGSSVTISW